MAKLSHLNHNEWLKYVKEKWPGWICVLMLISHVCLGVVLDTRSHVLLFYMVIYFVNGRQSNTWVLLLRVAWKSKSHLQPREWSFLKSFNYIYMAVLCPLPLQCYCVIYFILIVCPFYYMVWKLLLSLMLIAKPCMLLGKLPCIKSLN